MKVECYNCGSLSNTFYAAENGYTVVRCSDCGLLFVNNPPDESRLIDIYTTGENITGNDRDVVGEFSELKITHYLRVLEDLYNGKMDGVNTWLDVGCGHGEFMVAVRQYSHGKVTLKGLEPNIKKQELSQKRNLDITFFDINTHEGRYDAISLLNVYSHLLDPPEFLSSLQKLLTPGGELIIRTGNTAHLSVEDHFKPFYLPGHLSFASEKILVDILKRLEFTILDIKKYPYLPLKFKRIVREFVKLLIPGYQSRFRYYVKWKTYSQTDMFIRAKRKT